MPLSDWISDLTPATATRRTLDENPASPTYGDEVDAGSFTVGYQKASSRELQRMGREYGTDLYIMLADLDSAGNAPAQKDERVVLAGVGELNVTAVIEYRQPDERMARIEGEFRS